LKEESKFLTEGVRSMFLSTFAFFVANVCVKQIVDIPAMEIVFFRCVLASTFCFVGLKHARVDWRGTNHKLLLLRGLFGTTALFLFFITLQNIPLASAMTIQYLSPSFTTIIAIFFLGESVPRLQWLFYGLAFARVLLIERDDLRVSPYYLVIGIISALCSGMAYNLVRSMKGREHPLTVVLHFQLVGVVAGFISLFFSFRMPTGWDWFYIVLIGIFSQLGQMFLTNALQKERVAGVAIINYTGLIYALLAGSIIFSEPQSAESLAGMLLVVFGVLLSVVYSNRKREIEKIEATAG